MVAGEEEGVDLFVMMEDDDGLHDDLTNSNNSNNPPSLIHDDDSSSDYDSMPSLVKRGRFSNDDKSDSDSSNKDSIPDLVAWTNESDNDTVIPAENFYDVLKNDNSDDASVPYDPAPNQYHSNSEGDNNSSAIPRLIAWDEPINDPDDRDDKMSMLSNDENDNDDNNPNNRFIDPFLVNIVLDLSNPNPDEEEIFDSMIENSDASLLFADVVGHPNNTDTPRDWDVVSTSYVDNRSYNSDFEEWPPYALSDRQLQGPMTVETENLADMDSYDRLKIVDDHKRRLSRLMRVLQIDRDLFVEHCILDWIVRNDGIEDFDDISKQHIQSSYFL